MVQILLLLELSGAWMHILFFVLSFLIYCTIFFILCCGWWGGGGTRGGGLAVSEVEELDHLIRDGPCRSSHMDQ